MDATASRTRPTVARTAALGVIGATVAPAAIWALATAAGAELTVSFGNGQPPIEITVVTTLITALLASLAGWGLLAVLRRLTAKARTVWNGAATVVAVLSLGGPLSAAASGGTKVALVAMHLAVATVLIAALGRSAR
jgi:Family of unknown function (DUF6069)